MATKKVKRARALAKHEAFMKEERERNNTILNRVRARREREKRKEWQDQHDKAHQKKLVDECPLCLDIRRAAKRKERAKEKVE